MFERFTDRARRVVVLAQEEARLLGHNYIGTEHLLLGLIQEGDGVAARALEALGVELQAVRRQVEEIIGRGHEASAGHIPFTPRAKKVLELALREAQKLGHHYIGTEHILLGLIREGEGVAAQVLEKMGAGLNVVRQKVKGLLGAEARPLVEGSVASTAGEVEAGEHTSTPRCSRCQADLAEHLRFTELTVSEHQGEGTRDVVVSFCDRCGTALGVWGA